MKIRESFLPYSRPFYGEAEAAGVTAALDSGWWSRGPLVGEFEQAFASSVGVRHALALNSCTAGLFLALLLHKVQPGDEVITTPMTFCATANVIVHCGATPVFADVDEATGLLDPAAVERAITPRTRGIVPVHYAGRACNMEELNRIAARHGLFVVEDAAHAVYTTYENGKPVGSGDNLTAFSFYATKNLSTGEGGMLTTNDDELYARAQTLSLHGMSRHAWSRFSAAGSWRYNVEAPGYKLNMTDPAAALGLAQLARLEDMQRRRADIAAAYNAAFATLPGVDVLPDAPFGRNAWHLYMLKIRPNGLTAGRDRVIAELNEHYRIGTSVHYIPVHHHPYYRTRFGTRRGDYPHTERLYRQILSLPLYPSMTDEEVSYVCEAVRELAARFAK